MTKSYETSGRSAAFLYKAAEAPRGSDMSERTREMWAARDWNFIVLLISDDMNVDE